MRAHKLASIFGVLGILLAGRPVSARSISDNLGAFINNEGLGTVVSGVQFPNIAGEFIQRVALGSLQLPVPANSTSFTYSYNPALGVFERSSGSLGPVFVDRAETVGEGHFDLIFSYQFANLKNLDNESFGRQLEFAFQTQVQGANVVGAFVGDDFNLKENVFAFNGTYGITDHWDVNLLIPLVYTTLDLNAQAGCELEAVPAFRSCSFHVAVLGTGASLLRTKYRFYEDPDVVLLAGAITFRMPSGNAGNFQGLGDFTITPTLIASRPFGRNDLHMNLGMEFDTQNSEASRARYAIGATIQPLDQLAFLIDILGSSGLDNDHFTIPTGNVTPNCTVARCVNYTATPTSVEGVVPRSDIVDLSTGIKFNPFASANVYLLAIIPLTRQGLRAPVVPAGGIEWTF